MVCVVTVITTAAELALVSGPVGFGEKLHEPANSGVTVQLRLTGLLYPAPTRRTLRL